MRRLLLSVLLLSAHVAAAAAPESGRMDGKVFGDYYYVAAHHDHDLRDRNGFWFRRVQLGYTRFLGGGWSGRIRMEFASPGDFRSDDLLLPDLKDAYLQWQGRQCAVVMGLSRTPTVAGLQRAWGYRAVEKVLSDLHKMGGSRDTGLQVRGHAGRWRYAVMLANGSGKRAEANKQKKIMAALGRRLSGTLSAELYGDYEGRPDDRDRWTVQGWLAARADTWRAGVAALAQTRRQGPGAGQHTTAIGMLFGAARLSPHWWGFARVDRLFDPSPGGEAIDYLPFAPDSRATLCIAGLEWRPQPGVHLMPNVEVVAYDRAGLDTDVMPRVTLFYAF